MTAVGRTSVSCFTGQSAASELLLWDGRLDNRAAIEQMVGATVAQASDGAVVLAAYERHSSRALREAIGDWSIVIRDGRRGELVLASDYAGVRPLYYRILGQQVMWSTHLPSLVAATGSHDDLDEHYIRGFLERGSGAHRTPFAGIECVPAGHAVHISAKAVTRERLWTPPLQARLTYADPRDYDEQFRTLFAEAVAVRLQTAAPVLAELSGGLDSSSVACVADWLIRSGRVPAPSLHTVSYVHELSTDLTFIQAVERFRGRPGVHLSTHQYPLVAATHAGISMPSGWGPPHEAATQVARAHGAGVLLTGQAGDLATGNWLDDSLQVAGAVRRGRLAQAVTESIAWSRVTARPTAHILARAALAALPAPLAPRRIFEREPAGAAACLTAELRRRTATPGPSPFADEWRAAAPERRSHVLALAAMREVRALQRLEEAPQLDYTHPFSHRPLIEFLFSIPAEVLCRPGRPRALMRRALADLWPTRLRRRRSKSLFGAAWIDALRPLATTMLAQRSWHVAERGWVDRARAAGKLARLIHGLDAEDPEPRHIILLEHWLAGRAAARSHEKPAA